MEREPTEMELRVAEAVAASWGEACHDDPPSPMTIARAAIQAMKDPPPDFIDAIAGYFMTPRERLGVVWNQFIKYASPGP